MAFYSPDLAHMVIITRVIGFWYTIPVDSVLFGFAFSAFLLVTGLGRGGLVASSGGGVVYSTTKLTSFA